VKKILIKETANFAGVQLTKSYHITVFNKPSPNYNIAIARNQIKN
jgi:hypothetical protein|tara:strand:- start:4 stop:138 length:135 start_codon:yes stop_codon:yes gene_type:complete